MQMRGFTKDRRESPVAGGQQGSRWRLPATLIVASQAPSTTTFNLIKLCELMKPENNLAEEPLVFYKQQRTRIGKFVTLCSW